MDLKNMTMDDLKQKFSTIDKKTIIKFGIGFGAIIIFLIIYYVILNPMVKKYSMSPDFDNRWITGGSLDQIIEESQLDTGSILSRIKKFAKERA